MEHRWSRRQSLQGEVMVALPGCRPEPVRISDLSVGGLGVAGGDLRWPEDAFVTVSFSVDRLQDASHHRVLAQVVYCRRQQAGLLFIDPGRETLQTVRALVAQPVSGRVCRLTPPPHAA